MDKYIKMLLLQLSGRYRVTITTTMYVMEEPMRTGATYALRISNKGEKTALCEYQTHSKRELVMEMMKWAKAQSP